MHGQYIRSMDRQPISIQDTFLWLKQGVLKGDTESEIIAAQDQTLQTKYHATNILQTETYIKFDETTDHMLSACPILAKERYIQGHDKVFAQLHFDICKGIGVQLDNERWYDHVPKVVTCHEDKVTTL